MAKKTSLIIGLLMALICSDQAFAQMANQGGNSTPIVVPVYRKDRDRTDRPKSPSRQYIDCVYSEGVLSIGFLLPEGEATISVTDLASGASSQYGFDSAEPADIYVGELSAAYIYIETEYGHAYEGEWNIQKKTK